MKAVFFAVAVVNGVAAVLFAFLGKYETAFLTASVGAVAWLLHYRQTLKEKLPAEAEPEEVLDEEESDEEVRS